MAYNTGNSVPSTDAKDFIDNCENLDKALNSLESTFQDRLGVTRSTYEGVVQGLSFFNVGTFAVGFTLTNSRQTLTYDGHEYGWSGVFPKVVNAGSIPTPLGSGWWIDRSDVTLRGDIEASVFEALRRSYAEAGLTLVDGSFEEGGTLQSQTDVLLNKKDGKAYSWTGSYPSGGYVVAAGTDPTVNSSFVMQMDKTLRDDIASEDGSALIAGYKASEIVNFKTPASKVKIPVNNLYVVASLLTPSYFGAHGNTTTLGDLYSTIAEAKQDYPFATALSQTIDYAACQLALNTQNGFHLDKLYYIGNDTLVAPSGAVVTGVGCDVRFSVSLAKCGLVSNPGVTTITSGATETTGVSFVGLNISNCNIFSDYPLEYGNKNVAPSDASASAYVRLPRVENVALRPITTGAGIGINCTKVFDGTFNRVDIANFAKGIRLNGCDLSVVKHCRINQFYDYAIYELSGGSIGSQNEIYHNDIIQSQKSGSVFISSASRHVRIHNNYIEHPGSATPPKRFIDAGSQAATEWGDTAAIGQSCYIKENRIDGMKYATEKCYRIASEFLFTDIDACGAFQDVTTPDPILFYPSAIQPLFKAPLHKRNLIVKTINSTWDWCGAGLNGKFNPRGVNVGAELFGMFGNGISASNYQNVCLNEVGELVILPAFSSIQQLDVFNRENYYPAGSNFKLKVIAKAEVAGEGIRFMQSIGGGGSGSMVIACTTSFVEYEYAFSGNASLVGWYLQAPATANTKTVTIKSIEFVKV